MKNNRHTLSFAEAAANIQARLSALRDRDVALKDIADLVVLALEGQAALFRYLDREFPDAEKIRAAVFER